MVQENNTVKNNEDTRVRRILSLIIGFVFFYLCGFVGKFLAARVSSYGTVAITIMNSFLNAVTILFVAVGIIFALVQHNQSEKKRAVTNKISLFIISAFQILLILALLVLGNQITALYIRPDLIFNILVPAFRAAAISMTLFSTISIVLGMMVKRKSFLFLLLSYIIVFVLSVAAMFIGLGTLNWGVTGIAIGIGMIQPVVALLPNVENWSGSAALNSIASFPVTQDNAETEKPTVQMFCPQCGTRLPAGTKYCDQCGSELKALLHPEPTTTSSSVSSKVEDAPSGGFAVLGFFIPLVGLILFLVWHDTYPLRAKSAGKGALAGVITGVALAILSIIIQLSLFARLF